MNQSSLLGRDHRVHHLPQQNTRLRLHLCRQPFPFDLYEPIHDYILFWHHHAVHKPLSLHVMPSPGTLGTPECCQLAQLVVDRITGEG